MLCGLCVGSPLSESSDARQNLVSTLGPDEWLGVSVMRIDEFLNRRLELGHAPERPAAKLLVGQLGKPALDQAQPRRVGGGEVHVEARPLGEPTPNERRFMGTVIVHDDV